MKNKSNSAQLFKEKMSVENTIYKLNQQKPGHGTVFSFTDKAKV